MIIVFISQHSWEENGEWFVCVCVFLKSEYSQLITGNELNILTVLSAPFS